MLDAAVGLAAPLRIDAQHLVAAEAVVVALRGEGAQQQAVLVPARTRQRR